MARRPKHKKLYSKETYKFDWNGRIFGEMRGVRDKNSWMSQWLFMQLRHEVTREIDREIIRAAFGQPK